jgi:hypothetical protein
MGMHYKYVLAVLLISLLTGVAVATIMKTIQLPATFTIEKAYNINLFDVDGSTPLTSLNLGQLQKDFSKFFPGGVCSIADLAGYYYLNNTNEGAFYLGFNVTGAPADIIFRVYICKGNETLLDSPYEWTQLTVDTTAPATVIYDKVIESKITNPDPDTQYARWFLSVYASPNTTWGDYTAQLVFTAHNSPSG